MTGNPRLRLPVGVLLLAIVTLLVSCGVPTDDSPREFSLSGELQAPAESSPSTVVDTPSADIFLVNTDPGQDVSLVPQGIEISPSSDPASYIRAVLDQLIATTPGSDQNNIANFTLALTLEEVEVVDGTVVRLTFSDLGDLTGQGLTYGIAQLVFTATSADGPEGVDGVVFLEERSGQVSEVQVSLEGGQTSRTGEPVRQSDFTILFNQLNIPFSSTTTASTTPATTVVPDSTTTESTAPAG